MMTCKLVLRNLRKNIKDYFIYFLTLTIAISLFYAFNTVTADGALDSLGTDMLSMMENLNLLIKIASVVIAFMIAFLILYVNRFLLKRRKKELGIYMLLGMKKRKISQIFVGETLLIGFASLISGIFIGIFFAQILTIAALRVFGGLVNNFTLNFSKQGFLMTVGCFAIIYVIAMLFNVVSVSGVKLIDLLLAEKKNEELVRRKNIIYVLGFLGGVACFLGTVYFFQDEGLLAEIKPMTAVIVLIVLATILFFYTISAVVLTLLRKKKKFYFKDINSFLVRQIGSRIQGNFISMSVVCVLLAGTILMLTIGTSIAITMSQMSKDFAPYDYVVLKDASENEASDVLEAAKEYGYDLYPMIDSHFQITVRKAELNYQYFFKGQEIKLWSHDVNLPERKVYVLSVSDYNQCLVEQGKEPVSLKDDEFLLNCNYKGTQTYMEHFLADCEKLEVSGTVLYPKQKELLENTYMMTSIGDNDRGTLIVPDVIAEGMEESTYVAQGFYKAETDSKKVHEFLDELVYSDNVPGENTFGWNTKIRMNTMYYTKLGIPVFLCTYIGLILLLICVALISVQQLTEIADNKYRYLILKKQGVTDTLMRSTVHKQVGVYFAAPLLLAAIYSGVSLPLAMTRISDLYNIEIGTNIWCTLIVLILTYGGYYLTTAYCCEKMICRDRR